MNRCRAAWRSLMEDDTAADAVEVTAITFRRLSKKDF